MDGLITKFCTRYNFSKADALYLISQMEVMELKKLDKIIEEGKLNSSLYLVNDGLMRGYSMIDGIDTTMWFASEGEIVFSVWSYVANKFSHITIESLSDCRVYCVSKTKLEELFNSSIAFANLGRKLIEQHCLSVEDWLIDWEKPTAKERYLALLDQTPEIIMQVPLYQIASYLRITPQSLSRIRTQL